MTEFYFFRHCETEMNAQPHLIGGQSNHTPPTERGKAQARLLGDYLVEEGIVPDAVFSSGAVRTNFTARTALETAGIPLEIRVDDRLLEMGHGDYEGRIRDEVYTPENLLKYRIAELDGKLPGGHSVLDVQLRKRAFLDEAHGEFPAGIVFVFGHGLAIRSLAGHIKNQTKAEILAETTDNVSLTRIDVIDGQPQVLFVGKDVIARESV